MRPSNNGIVVAIVVVVATALAAQALLPDANVLVRLGLPLGAVLVLLVILHRKPTSTQKVRAHEPEPSMYCAGAQGVEWDWFACDEVGHVALISSGGSGQVPRTLIAQQSSIADLLAHLEVTCDADSWQKAAERGLFAYDVNINGGPFRLVRSPLQPRTLAVFPEPHRSLIARAKVRGVFSKLRRIDPYMVECPLQGCWTARGSGSGPGRNGHPSS